MTTAQLLTDLEKCPRKAFWGDWEPNRLFSTQMVTKAIRVALVAQESQESAFGELAGSAVLQLAEDRGLETDLHDIYSSVIHYADLSDILVSAIRNPGSPPWLIPEPSDNWTSDCYLSPDGSHLRRIVIVSHWTDERHYSECRSWFTLGEIAAYNLPMQLVVFVIGQERNGKRHGPWTTGFLHPANRVLRFRKKSRSSSEVFNEKWDKILREDHAEITRETWLESMLKDDVLPEVCFKVDVEIPAQRPLQRIKDMRDRKLEALRNLKQLPEQNLSSCFWPVPCQFRKLCHVLPEQEPSEKNGFIQIASGTLASPVSTNRYS